MKANSSFIANRKLRTTSPSTHALILMELVQRIDGLITTGIYCLVNDRLRNDSFWLGQFQSTERHTTVGGVGQGDTIEGTHSCPVILTNAFTIVVVVIQSIIMIIILKTRVIKRALTKRKRKTCHIAHPIHQDIELRTLFCTVCGPNTKTHTFYSSHSRWLCCVC